MAYEITIPLLGIPSSTGRQTPSRIWTRSGVLDDGTPMNLRTGSTRPFCCGSRSTPVLSKLKACSFPPRHLADTEDQGSLYFSSFPAPTNVQVSFVYSEKKEERWRVWGRTGCAHSKVLGFDLFLLCVSGGGVREKESERLGHIGLPFFLLCCVCSVLC